MKQKTINTYIIVYNKTDDLHIENYGCTAYTKSEAYKKYNAFIKRWNFHYAKILNIIEIPNFNINLDLKVK